MAAFRGSFPSVTSLGNNPGIVNLGETLAPPPPLRLRAMPLLAPPPPSQPVRGDKRRLAVIAVAIALLFAGIAVWSLAHPGRYDQSRAGCVTVTIPSTTGGALLHQCGTGARHLCRSAFRHHDRLSLLIRPSCRQAGLG
jgi:predicted small integral membrane protein